MRIAIFLSSIFSLAATLGSLYFSEFLGFNGFITIPLLAFIAFSLINISLILGKIFQRKNIFFTS